MTAIIILMWAIACVDLFKDTYTIAIALTIGTVLTTNDVIQAGLATMLFVMSMMVIVHTCTNFEAIWAKLRTRFWAMLSSLKRWRHD